MNPLLRNIVLAISGGLVIASILMAKIGVSRTALSKRDAAILAGVGAGIGVGIFIFFGVSDYDLIGSIFTGIVIALVVGFSVIFPNRWLE
jgi:hypothetical protein